MKFRHFSICCLVLSFHIFIDSVEGDETAISLHRVKRQKPRLCLANQYKCTNGQCVSSAAVCNGIKNCIDGSDETWEACQKTYPNSCILPSYTDDKNLVINCDSSTNVKIFSSSKGDFVQELTLISFTCNSEYVAAGQQFQSVCLEGKWTPQFSSCLRTCEPLQIANNAEAKCYVNDQETECKTQHLAGTVIRAKCQSNFSPNAEEAVCDSNGKWNVDRIECLGCGTRLTANPPFQYPWTVAIYLKEFKVLVCAGTILSPGIVVTAASCFDKEKANKPSNYIVVVGKRKRKYREKDSKFQRDYTIQKIHIHDNFQEDTNTNDIAILELSDKITYNSDVYSVCVDWDQNNPSNLKDDSIGHIANFIVNDALGTATTKLYIPSQMEIFFQSNPPLAYISKHTCVNSITERLKGLIGTDKFCARKQDSQPLLILDTGTGFVVEINQKYYLQGIASGMFSPVNTFRVFTDVTKHITWITQFLNSPRKPQKPSNAQVAERLPDLVIKDNVFAYDSLRINCSNGDMYTEFVDGCTLPSKSLYNIDYDLTCPETVFQRYCNQSTEGAPIPQYTSLRYKCKNGFASYSLDKSAASVCFQGVWTPPISQCSRVCKSIKPQNVIVQCTYEGRTTNCDNKLIVNTEVRPVACQPEYKKNITTDFGSIYCRESGEWSGTLLECVPICGHPSRAKVTPQIHGGDPVLLGEFPWHAAIYEKTRNNTLICGATIVSPYALISAAHCFYDRNHNRQRDGSDYEVGVSKVSQNRFQLDSETTHFYEIESLIFNNFRSSQLRFQRDIVIVVTKNKISFNPQVSPVCLFQDANTKISKGSILDVAGWGIDETGDIKGSPFLKTAHLPYLSFDDCSKIATTSLSEYLSTEKFCVGGLNQSALDQGDSGGGLVVRSSIDASYYLVGIVSIRVSDGTFISLCTYILEYVQWINLNLNEINRAKNLVV